MEFLVVPLLTRASSHVPYDNFVELGLFLYYDASDRLEAAEFAGPARLVFDGHDFLGQPFADVLAVLTDYDPKIEVDGAGAISRRLGLSAYAPFALKEPSEPVEAMLACTATYYDP